jgi:hypothetical protein
MNYRKSLVIKNLQKLIYSYKQKGIILYKRALLTYLLLLVGIFIFLNIGIAQERSLKKRDVPKAVLEAFKNSYPKATIKGYSKETDNGKVVYEVESIERKKHRNISYTSDGRVVTIEESIAYAASKNMLFI